MTPPVALAYLAAGTGVVGAVNGTMGTVNAADSGVHIGHCEMHYPKEFPPEQFAHPGQSIQHDVVKFFSPGYWDNTIVVAMTGYVSNDHGPLMGYPQSAHPNVPANRFMLLTLDKSATSEDMSKGLLTCNIEPWGGTGAFAEGSAEDPWVAFHVHGRFDPVGIGDAEYSFKLNVSSWGQVHLESEVITGTSVLSKSITFEGDHVLVRLA
jgi:hypothetical protein